MKFKNVYKGIVTTLIGLALSAALIYSISQTDYTQATLTTAIVQLLILTASVYLIFSPDSFLKTLKGFFTRTLSGFKPEDDQTLPPE